MIDGKRAPQKGHRYSAGWVQHGHDANRRFFLRIDLNRYPRRAEKQ